MSPSSPAVLMGRTAVLVRRAITLVVFVIAGLAFAFSFDNGWLLGLQLGVPHWVAPAVTPAVDLSVLALIVSIQYIRAQGIENRLLGPRLLLALSGAATLVINTANAVLEQRYGRAAFDAVAPLLLILWGEVGPGLLALLNSVVPNAEDGTRTVPSTQGGRPDTAELVPDEKGPSPEMVRTARELDAAHRKTHKRPITRDKLRAQLKVSNAVASQLVRIVRAPTEDDDAR
jgi:hypothetical protein